MAGIDEFRICLDLSEREELHDYVSGQTLTRPSWGTWDPAAFRDLGQAQSSCYPDSKGQLVELLDSAIRDREVADRSVSLTGIVGQQNPISAEMDDDVFGGSYQKDLPDKGLPARVLPVYAPGDIVSGCVILKLNRELHAENITLGFLGQAACNMRSYHSYGVFNDTSKQKYISRMRLIWKMADKDVDGFAELSDMTRLTNTAARSKLLIPGWHHFSFEFTIPKAAGQSMPPLVPSASNYVHLMYRLKATIHTGSVITMGNITTHKGIWVAKTFDINCDPANLEPVSVQNTLEGGTLQCWLPGQVGIRAQLSRSGFVKGEAVPISIEIDNVSGVDITKVKARIVLQGKALMGKTHIAKTIRLKSRKVIERAISGDTNPLFKWRLPWDFSDSIVDSALLPVGKLTDSKLIDIGYVVEVTMKRSYFCGSLRFHIPIVVGTEDSSGTAAPRMSQVPPL